MGDKIAGSKGEEGDVGGCFFFSGGRKCWRGERGETAGIVYGKICD